jgi:hypothetical protein
MKLPHVKVNAARLFLAKAAWSPVNIKTMLLLPALVLTTAVEAWAQKRQKRAAEMPPAKQERRVDPLAESRSEFVRITKEYKASLEQLIAFYEADVDKAKGRLTKLKELYAEGLLSQRDLDASRQALVAAQDKVDEARARLKKADEQIAEALLEVQLAEQLARDAARAAASNSKPRGGRLIRTTAYVRYEGTGGWSLSGAGSVQRFYAEKFGRSLPVSAFGQSSVHDRWGLDHRNAMDVGLNPDSIEGQALTAYLRANGIPFLAFRFAIPGAATAPHIHIGRPSQRIGR